MESEMLNMFNSVVIGKDLEQQRELEDHLPETLRKR